MKNITLLTILLLTISSCSKDDGVEIKSDLASQIEGNFNGEFDDWNGGTTANYKVKIEKVSGQVVKLNCDHFTDVIIDLSGNIDVGILGNTDSVFQNFTYLVQEEKLEFFTGDAVFEGVKE